MLATNLGLVTAYFFTTHEVKTKAYVSGVFFLLATVGAIMTYLKNREPAVEEKTPAAYKPVLGAKKAGSGKKK